MGAARCVAPAIKLLLAGDDVHGRCVRIGSQTVGDHKGTTACRRGGALKCKREPKFFQERQDPGFAGDSCCTDLAASYPGVEGVPMDQRLGECPLDFIAKASIEAEVHWALTRHVLRRGCDLLDEIAADQST